MLRYIRKLEALEKIQNFLCGYSIHYIVTGKMSEQCCQFSGFFHLKIPNSFQKFRIEIFTLFNQKYYVFEQSRN